MGADCHLEVTGEVTEVDQVRLCCRSTAVAVA